MKALLSFYKSLLFQGVHRNVFKSTILHFLAMLRFDKEINQLYQANNFLYMLAGIMYCVRMLAIEIILPSMERNNQDEEDNKWFREV